MYELPYLPSVFHVPATEDSEDAPCRMVARDAEESGVQTDLSELTAGTLTLSLGLRHESMG